MSSNSKRNVLNENMNYEKYIFASQRTGMASFHSDNCDKYVNIVASPISSELGGVRCEVSSLDLVVSYISFLLSMSRDTQSVNEGE